MNETEIYEQLSLLMAQGWSLSVWEDTEHHIIFTGEKHVGKTKEDLRFIKMRLNMQKENK